MFGRIVVGYGPHAPTHKAGGHDELDVDDLAVPDALTNFGQQEITNVKKIGMKDGANISTLAPTSPSGKLKITGKLEATSSETNANSILRYAALLALKLNQFAAPDAAVDINDQILQKINYADLKEIAEPASPAAGYLRLWDNTGANPRLKQKDPAGLASTFIFLSDVAYRVEKAIDHTWNGDDANDREIELADDYQLLLLLLQSGSPAGTAHPALAYAFTEDVWGCFHEAGGASDVEHHAGGDADAHFQGKMSAPDATKIKLGSSGGDVDGWNNSGKTYRLMGFKFASMA